MKPEEAIQRLTEMVTFCSGGREKATLNGEPLSAHDEEIRRLNFTALDIAISALEKQISSADVVPWSWLSDYAKGKRCNYASDFVIEAKAVWNNEKKSQAKKVH